MEIGVCYYPEQWPQERWPIDARQMAEAGIGVVRIGEFAWAAYEPAREEWSWEWLDGAIATLHDAGLSIILGTPTATPPIWLARERPAILSVDDAGRRRPYGTRRHTCPTSAEYREEAARVVRALADRYGAHPAVVAWQIDNEPGNHDSARCWCEQCETAFGAWLEDRYGTVEGLNEAWGTLFWSQVYPDFAAVRLPRPAPTGHSPSLLLAHRRFASQQVISGLEEQAAIIRASSPDRDITVNFYAGDTFIDYRRAARIGGIGAIDSYPHGAARPGEVRFWHDLARGISGTNRGWIMEQQPGAINWTPHNPPVPDGQVTEWLQDAAADGIERTLLFRWRAAVAGQEQYHTGLLRHDGRPDRALRELTAAVPDLTGHQPPDPGTTAIVYDYEDAWAVEIEPHQEGLTHRQLVVNAHAAARLRGPVDVVGWGDDLATYRLILAPAALLTSGRRAQQLVREAERGATVVVGPRTFTRDAESVASAAEMPPLGISRHAGAHVREGLSAPHPLRHSGTQDDVGPWLDVVEASSAEVVATVDANGHLDGQAIATSQPVGQGRMVLHGASSQSAWSWLLAKIT